MRITVVVLVAVLAAPAVAVAQDRLLESAERLAAGTLLQMDQERERSAGRTWAGVTMLAAGGIMAAYYGASTCAENRFAGEILDIRSCGEAATLFSVGAGVAVVGVLFATIWSDVPVARDLAVQVSPGRLTVGRTFGF